MKSIQFKVIKPKPLNVKAMQGVMEAEALKLGQMMAQDYSNITKNWLGGGVPFKAKTKNTRNNIVINVNAISPNSKGAEIWGYLDKGTKAHTVTAKKKGFLAFPSMYRPGSRPNSLFVGATATGGPTMFAKSVRVSGIQARNWSRLMQQKWKTRLPKEVASTMTHVAKVSGHKL